MQKNNTNSETTLGCKFPDRRSLIIRLANFDGGFSEFPRDMDGEEFMRKDSAEGQVFVENEGRC
jgi:hypothetical protein